MSSSQLRSDCSDELRDLLGDWLRARHLTQTLRSIDANKDATGEAESLRQQGFSVVGVVDQGRIVGSVPVDALSDQKWRERVEPVTHEKVIEGDAPLVALISRLADRHWLFVRRHGNVDGFVSRSDLQRAPFRMLLFGLISLFELRLLHLVHQHYSESSIAESLNANRFEKARFLHGERKTRGEELHLADCLQIADKRDLLLALPDCLNLLGFASHKKAYRFFGKVEALRDRLVHANDLIAGTDWEEVLAITIQLSEFLSRTSKPQ